MYATVYKGHLAVSSPSRLGTKHNMKPRWCGVHVVSLYCYIVINIINDRGRVVTNTSARRAIRPAHWRVWNIIRIVRDTRVIVVVIYDRRCDERTFPLRNRCGRPYTTSLVVPRQDTSTTTHGGSVLRPTEWLRFASASPSARCFLTVKY